MVFLFISFLKTLLNLKGDNKEIFLELRKSDFRYEFGVYDEDKNMILVTKVTED